MVDDVKNITETAESKAQADALDRARIAREKRESEQRKRLDELRAHAAAAQAQREKRDEDRRRRLAEQRAKDDDRRLQVEERKRAIWEASISRREALLQRERDRSERLERARAARSAPRPAFAFGSSTPRLLEPLDSAGFFWAARSTNPIDQMNFFESLAASTTNVMFASAPLTRRASALQLDSDTDNKDEPDRQPTITWSSVARRRTDLVPTVPASRAPGRAYSMTRLDRIPSQRPLGASPSMHHLNRTRKMITLWDRFECRSGDTTPGSRPGSALSAAPVLRRASSAPRRPRPASIAGTGVNTPRGGPGEALGASAASTPGVSRDGSVLGADVPRRPAPAPRRPRPASLHASAKPAVLSVAPGDGKPPLHRKPKPSKDHDKTPRGKSLSASPGRTLSPSPAASKEPSVDKEIKHAVPSSNEKSHLIAAEVSQKLEALQIHNGHDHAHDQVNENKENVEINKLSKPEQIIVENKPIEIQKPVEKNDSKPDKIEIVKKEETKREEVKKEETKKEEVKKEELKKEEIKKEETKKEEEKKENAQEKTDESEMTASMTARRITTEEEAKAALAERRRKAREEFERQAELERQRLQREAEEEAERQRQEEERQRREEEEARELAALQRRMDDEKLQKAIQAQQQLEREESERRAREEVERKARLQEEEAKRRAAEEAERLRRVEAEREEKERLARKQRVEAIMARTRLKKQQEEDKKKQEASGAPATAALDNGNASLLAGLSDAQVEESKQDKARVAPAATNNGNVADMLGLNTQHDSEEPKQQPSKVPDLLTDTTNGNHATASAAFIHTERLETHAERLETHAERLDTTEPSAENTERYDQTPKRIDDDFTTHNGHNSHPLTLQNAI